MEVFFDTDYTVTSESDRMGYRLQGTPIHHDEGVPQSIISEPILPWNIQLPADGQPIILLVEQTTGGYTKIATVISTDLPKVAQAMPGNRIWFKKVTLEEAHALYRSEAARMKEIEAFFSGTSGRRSAGRDVQDLAGPPVGDFAGQAGFQPEGLSLDQPFAVHQVSHDHNTVLDAHVPVDGPEEVRRRRDQMVVGPVGHGIFEAHGRLLPLDPEPGEAGVVVLDLKFLGHDRIREAAPDKGQVEGHHRGAPPLRGFSLRGDDGGDAVSATGTRSTKPAFSLTRIFSCAGRDSWTGRP
jgi:hypothetical protein